MLRMLTRADRRGRISRPRDAPPGHGLAQCQPVAAEQQRAGLAAPTARKFWPCGTHGRNVVARWHTRTQDLCVCAPGPKRK